MVRLTRLSGRTIVVNADVIESLEATPDTVLRLTNGQKLAVQESIDAVIELVVAYRRKIGCAQPQRGPDDCASASPQADHED